jgi:hypothetical protein
MAKETKAEAAARHELEAEVSYQAFVREYPARFAAVLFEYLQLEHAGFRVKKMDAETYSFYRADHQWSDRVLKVSPPANRNWEVTTLLGEVESELADYAAEQAEADRKYAVKAAALLKLSAEERELLGV